MMKLDRASLNTHDLRRLRIHEHEAPAEQRLHFLQVSACETTKLGFVFSITLQSASQSA